MSLDAITDSLSKLSISPTATVSHAATNSPASWREALEASSSAPKDFELIKTLVYKPKTAKTATPVPVFVIARETTDVPSGVLGKTLNLKDLRLASEDLLKEFFSLDKNSRESPFSTSFFDSERQNLERLDVSVGRAGRRSHCFVLHRASVTDMPSQSLPLPSTRRRIRKSPPSLTPRSRARQNHSLSVVFPPTLPSSSLATTSMHT